MNELTPRTAKEKSPTLEGRENGKPVRLKSGSVLTHLSAEARSLQILVAIMAFRDGDFSVRLPADWGDTDGRIAEAFNQVIAQ